MESGRLYSIGAYAATAARLTMLAALAYAPWAFGSTRDWAVNILVAILFAAGALWVAGRAAQGRLWETFGARLPASPSRRLSEPECRSGIQPLRAGGSTSRSAGGVPIVVAVATLLLLILGWSVTLNPSSYYDPYLEAFAPIDKVTRLWPSTVDAATSQQSMLRISALLLTLLMVTDLFRRTEWRRRLLGTMAIVGVSIALFGLAQKIFQSPLLFWEPERFSTTNFAMYRYHANAGAFLNLVWPISAAFAIEGFRRKETFVARAIWLPATLVLLVGLCVNLSKAAHLLAGGLLVLGFFALVWRRRHSGRRRGGIWLPIAVTAGAMLAMVAIIGPQVALDQWRHFIERDPLKEGRWWAAHACLDMIRAAPWFGFGPGTFSIVFPDFVGPYPLLRDGFWRYAHCDYLQTLVEWGAVGGVAWGVVWFGGMLKLALQLRSQLPASPSWRLYEPECRRGIQPLRAGGSTSWSAGGEAGGRGRGAEDLLDGAVVLGLCGVALHAAVDFPLQIASLQLYAVALLGVAWRRTANGRESTRIKGLAVRG